jgi:predicted peptidase
MAREDYDIRGPVQRLPLLIFTIGIITLPVMAQDKVNGFVARVYKSPSGQTMPYRLFIPPGYRKSLRYPLILWLHGGGGSGSDNLRQIQGDQIPGTHTWTKPENQAKHPAFVLVPQSDQGWDFTGSSSAAGYHDSTLSPALVLVLGMLDSLKVEFSLDTKRLYVAGQSIGGFGTWNLITKKPDVFAAAIPLCGGGDPALGANVTQMPIWAFQGDADNATFRDSNRAMIAAIRKAGGKPRYTEYRGVGHEIWDKVFKEPDLVSWLFNQHK